jgi:hypothetical protein
MVRGVMGVHTQGGAVIVETRSFTCCPAPQRTDSWLRWYRWLKLRRLWVLHRCAEAQAMPWRNFGQLALACPQQPTGLGCRMGWLEQLQGLAGRARHRTCYRRRTRSCEA